MRNLSLQRVVAAVESAKMHVRSIPIDRQAVRVCGYGDGDGEPFLSCLCQGSSSSLFSLILTLPFLRCCCCCCFFFSLLSSWIYLHRLLSLHSLHSLLIIHSFEPFDDSRPCLVLHGDGSSSSRHSLLFA